MTVYMLFSRKGALGMTEQLQAFVSRHAISEHCFSGGGEGFDQFVERLISTESLDRQMRGHDQMIQSLIERCTALARRAFTQGNERAKYIFHRSLYVIYGGQVSALRLKTADEYFSYLLIKLLNGASKTGKAASVEIELGITQETSCY
jgi:hypothetical protein